MPAITLPTTPKLPVSDCTEFEALLLPPDGDSAEEVTVWNATRCLLKRTLGSPELRIVTHATDLLCRSTFLRMVRSDFIVNIHRGVRVISASFSYTGEGQTVREAFIAAVERLALE